MSSQLLFPVEGLLTERLVVRPVRVSDAAATLEFAIRNRVHLAPWEPMRSDDFYALPAAQARAAMSVVQMNDGQALHLLLFSRGTGDVIGTCNFSNVIRGAFQACHLGFSIGGAEQGQGLMFEGARLAIDEVFARYDLHRIMANHRPENLRSARLLERLGFEREGLARSYLKINGEWTDHVLTSLINPGH
jgi:ribosomal-protein-alanine N-acetyltransferase